MNRADVNRAFAALERLQQQGGGQIAGEDLDALERTLLEAAKRSPTGVLAALDQLASNPDRSPEENRGGCDLRDRIAKAVAS
jgi:hypothetical protein